MKSLRSRSFLGHKELFKLGAALHKFAESELNGRLSSKQIAERLSQELGFTVVARNVESAIESSEAAVKLVNGRKLFGAADVAHRVAALEKLIDHLYAKLGEEKPAE